MGSEGEKSIMTWNEYVDRKAQAARHPNASGGIFIMLTIIADLLAEQVFKGEFHDRHATEVR